MTAACPTIHYFVWSMILLTLTQAVPVNRSQDFKVAELTTGEKRHPLKSSEVCILESVIYTSGQTHPTSNPCETCTCQPPGFACSLKTCDVKPGCKALHSAGKCCPEYVCDCQRNGRTYGNGEKVEEPNPCNVCYCRGGEIQCTGVTCYERKDCDPHYVPGKCCPKYDHCPAIDMNKTPTEGITETTTQGTFINTTIASTPMFENVAEQPTSPEVPVAGTLEIIEIHPSSSRPFISSVPPVPEVSSQIDEKDVAYNITINTEIPIADSSVPPVSSMKDENDYNITIDTEIPIANVSLQQSQAVTEVSSTKDEKDVAYNITIGTEIPIANVSLQQSQSVTEVSSPKDKKDVAYNITIDTEIPIANVSLEQSQAVTEVGSTKDEKDVAYNITIDTEIPIANVSSLEQSQGVTEVSTDSPESIKPMTETSSVEPETVEPAVISYVTVTIPASSDDELLKQAITLEDAYTTPATLVVDENRESSVTSNTTAVAIDDISTEAGNASVMDIGQSNSSERAINETATETTVGLDEFEKGVSSENITSTEITNVEYAVSNTEMEKETTTEATVGLDEFEKDVAREKVTSTEITDVEFAESNTEIEKINPLLKLENGSSELLEDEFSGTPANGTIERTPDDAWTESDIFDNEKTVEDAYESVTEPYDNMTQFADSTTEKTYSSSSIEDNTNTESTVEISVDLLTTDPLSLAMDDIETTTEKPSFDIDVVNDETTTEAYSSEDSTTDFTPYSSTEEMMPATESYLERCVSPVTEMENETMNSDESNSSTSNSYSEGNFSTIAYEANSSTNAPLLDSTETIASSELETLLPNYFSLINETQSYDASNDSVSNSSMPEGDGTTIGENRNSSALLFSDVEETSVDYEVNRPINITELSFNDSLMLNNSNGDSPAGIETAMKNDPNRFTLNVSSLVTESALGYEMNNSKSNSLDVSDSSIVSKSIPSLDLTETVESYEGNNTASDINETTSVGAISNPALSIDEAGNYSNNSSGKNETAPVFIVYSSPGSNETTLDSEINSSQNSSSDVYETTKGYEINSSISKPSVSSETPVNYEQNNSLNLEVGEPASGNEMTSSISNISSASNETPESIEGNSSKLNLSPNSSSEIYETSTSYEGNSSISDVFETPIIYEGNSSPNSSLEIYEIAIENEMNSSISNPFSMSNETEIGFEGINSTNSTSDVFETSTGYEANSSISVTYQTPISYEGNSSSNSSSDIYEMAIDNEMNSLISNSTSVRNEASIGFEVNMSPNSSSGINETAIIYDMNSPISNSTKNNEDTSSEESILEPYLEKREPHERLLDLNESSSINNITEENIPSESFNNTFTHLDEYTTEVSNTDVSNDTYEDIESTTEASENGSGSTNGYDTSPGSTTSIYDVSNTTIEGESTIVTPNGTVDIDVEYEISDNSTSVSIEDSQFKEYTLHGIEGVYPKAETPEKILLQDATTEMSESSTKLHKNINATIAEVLQKWLSAAKHNHKVNDEVPAREESKNLLTALANELMRIANSMPNETEATTQLDVVATPVESSTNGREGSVRSLELENVTEATTPEPDPLTTSTTTTTDSEPDFDESDLATFTKNLFMDQSLAPVLSMISDQLQFLKIGEELPVYMEAPPEEEKSHHQGVVIVPTSNPIMVHMVKVISTTLDPKTPPTVEPVT